jgi:hypothetical protein
MRGKQGLGAVMIIVMEASSNLILSIGLAGLSFQGLVFRGRFEMDLTCILIQFQEGGWKVVAIIKEEFSEWHQLPQDIFVHCHIAASIFHFYFLSISISIPISTSVSVSRSQRYASILALPNSKQCQTKGHESEQSSQTLRAR